MNSYNRSFDIPTISNIVNEHILSLTTVILIIQYKYTHNKYINERYSSPLLLIEMQIAIHMFGLNNSNDISLQPDCIV